MQKSTDSKFNPLKSNNSSFISQDKITFKNEEPASYGKKLSTSQNNSASKSIPAKRGRKKLTSIDPFEDLNFSWEKTDYNSDPFESNSSRKSKSDDSENEGNYYGDSYTQSDDENNYESFSRG
jgi:hypothetical protein